MSEFANEITERVALASSSLQEAQTDGDDYLVEVRVGELEELARVAADHGVEVPGLAETLEASTGPIDVVLPERPQQVDVTDAALGADRQSA